MISAIRIANFRKHTSSDIQFKEGLVVIRGGNEASKTTLLEAIGYAIFGVKALRTPLADTVTWGQPEASLKVELDIIIDGVTYSVKRGKSGAECVYGGDGIVTGQVEVTGFMSRLLKVDSSTASKLMISSQVDIRGALESGPKATTELIERLAEFSQIDDLIELMQEKLPLGNGATAQGQLDAANGRLDRARGVPQPDLETLNAAVSETDSRVKVCTATLQTSQEAKDAAQADLARAQASASEREAVEARLARFEARYAAAMDEMRSLKSRAVPFVPDADDKVQKLLAQKADASKAIQAAAAWQEVRALVGDTGIARFKGNAEAWQVALHTAQAGLDTARASLRTGDVKFAALQAKLNSGNCTFCGKDFSDLPEVQAKNAETQAVMDSVSAELAAAQAAADTSQAEVKALNAVQAGGRPSLAAIQKHAAYLSVDDNSYPPFFSWKGEEPGAVVETDSIDNEIKRIRLAVREAADHASAIQANDRLLESFGTERTEIAERLQALGPLVNGYGIDKVAVLGSATQAVVAARSALAEATLAHTETKDALKDAVYRWDWAQKEVVEATAAVTTARDALASLDFNNALLKRVRAARPVIGDKLWNLVLAAVSSYFSEMRGEPCVVSKTSDGFLVDDHPVQTLSGSTLDILGLAIRVALVRTFLPNAPFLVLDEPAAAMDQTRTESMLGFLAGVGFKQILLVTHEDVSESVADHIITLGE